MNDVSPSHSEALAGWIEQPLIDRFEQVVAHHGDKAAVEDATTRLTYSELRRAAFHLARQITTAVPIGHPVGIVLPNSARFWIGAVACLAAGRPYVPIDPSYPAERNGQLVGEAGLSAVIVDGGQASIPYVPTAIPHLDIANSLETAGEPERTIASNEGPAIIFYTSGSSGRPKGICYGQRALLERVAHATVSMRLWPDDRVLVLSSPSTVPGAWGPLLALLNGATLYCADPLRMGIDGVLRFLEDARPTRGYAVPALLRTLLGAPGAERAFAHARLIRTGGDVLLQSDLALWRKVLPRSCRILVTLTSSEMPTVFQWFVPPEWTADGPRLPVGYPRPGVSFQLVDDHGAPVPVGEAGELVVKSLYLPLGIWQEGRLQPGPFLEDPGNGAMRILKTGDLVRIREDGLAEMMGRKDRQLKLRGLRVEPGDVENALRGCEGVADAVVIARRKAEEVVSLVAYVVPREPAAMPLADELKKELAVRLPGHMRPSQIRFIGAIPLLPGFKINSRALEELDEKQRATVDVTAAVSSYVAPRTRTEAALAGVWCKVLELKQVGVQDNFFDLGGSSLLLSHLVYETNRAFRTSIAAPQVIQNPTVAQLARVILGPEAGFKRRPKVIQLQEGTIGPSIYLVNAGPDEFKLARLMGTDRPVFGIESPWPLKWRQAACENRTSAMPNMEQLVAPYFAALSAHAGFSPCVLAGHSMAGRIAFEVACQFEKQGGKVEMVMLFDSWIKRPLSYKAARNRLREIWQPTPNRLTARRYLELLGRRVKSSWLPLRWMLSRQWLWIRTRFKRTLSSEASGLINLPDENGMPVEMELFRRLNDNATKSHRPRCLGSKGVLFRASDPYSEFYHAVDGSKGWTGLFRDGLEIIPVQGDHLSMIRDERHHPALAKVIERALMQVHTT